MNKYKFNSSQIIDKSKIDYEYNFSMTQIKSNNSQIESKRLKKLYMSRPFYSLKRNIFKRYNNWKFINLFNEYFCFCKGSSCLDIQISKECKYKYYLYLIDKNHQIYKKTDFLLMDFIFKNYTSADVYPIFERMINRNISAHYLTEREDIYEKYCHNNKNCQSVILVNESNYKINGDFLEKYFTLFLKLKHVLTSGGVSTNFLNNLFYCIDYITFILIGHGILYFKYYLLDVFYGPKSYDKFLVPNSKKIIDYLIKYGFKEENFLKFNLPRWEKYDLYNKANNKIGKIKSNSIFVMFTWREIKINRTISKYYINNIENLINNKQLVNSLLSHNLTLYFTLHHRALIYKNKFKLSRNIKFIYENDISECLSKTNLLVTDYSSIIFDIIYRKKPYIMFIPDANAPDIKENYKEFCYNLIKNFTNNDFLFENLFFDINSTVNKIKYYIDNNFKLDKKLKKFYNEFNFKAGLNINDLINKLLI